MKNPPTEPEAVVRRPTVDDRPEEHPVRISWTTPKRPDSVRAGRRPEMNEGRECSRAQRGLAEIAQPAVPVQRPEPMWHDHEPARKTEPVAVIEHGMRGYKAGCRCEDCRQAKRESRARKTDRARAARFHSMER